MFLNIKHLPLLFLFFHSLFLFLSLYLIFTTCLLFLTPWSPYLPISSSLLSSLPSFFSVSSLYFIPAFVFKYRFLHLSLFYSSFFVSIVLFLKHWKTNIEVEAREWKRARKKVIYLENLRVSGGEVCHGKLHAQNRYMSDVTKGCSKFTSTIATQKKDAISIVSSLPNTFLN